MFCLFLSVTRLDISYVLKKHKTIWMNSFDISHLTEEECEETSH